MAVLLFCARMNSSRAQTSTPPSTAMCDGSVSSALDMLSYQAVLHEAVLLLTTGATDKMALMFTLVQKDYTEPPGNTAQ